VNSGPRCFVPIGTGVLEEVQVVTVLVRHRDGVGGARGVFGDTMRRLSDHPDVVLAPVTSFT